MEYGDAWVKTLKKTIELYPRYDIPALHRPLAPHRRTRRTRAMIAADRAGRRGRHTDGVSRPNAGRDL